MNPQNIVMTAMAVFTAMAGVGCGGEKWLPADQASATFAVRAEARVLQICAVGATTCDPSAVRGLVRMPLCSHASMLAHHGDPVPDLGGVKCQTTP